MPVIILNDVHVFIIVDVGFHFTVPALTILRVVVIGLIAIRIRSFHCYCRSCIENFEVGITLKCP